MTAMNTTTISARIESIASQIQTRIEQQLETWIASAIEARICAVIEERMEAAIEARLNAAIDARLEAIIEQRLAAMPIEHIEQMVTDAEHAVQIAINSAFDRLAGITPPPLPTDAGEDAREKEVPACDPVTLPEPEPTPATDLPTITPTPEPTAQTDEQVTVAACSPVLSSDPANAEPLTEEVLPDGVEVALPAIDAKPARKTRGRKATK